MNQRSDFHIGTGKSYVLKKIIDELKLRGKNFQVTATSGRTAVLLGGLTLHRFLRITPACGSLQDYVAEFRTNRTAQIFKNLDILIIDEVGMLSTSFFDLISEILDYEREAGLPFGGVQVILAGDFLQLGPVVKNVSREHIKEIFQLPSWEALNLQIHNFKKVVRQNDEAFVNVLCKIRMGLVMDPDVQDVLRKASTTSPDPNRKYIEIFSKNADKNIANAQYLDTIHGSSNTYESVDRVFADGSLKDIDSIGEKTLVLKRGVIVMLLRNFGSPHDNLTNGTLGELVGFSVDGLPLVRFSQTLTLEIKQYEWEVYKRNASGQMKVVATRRQIPLALGHAFTSHKIQGLTLDNVIVHCKGIFGYGQFYTAISRVKSREGLILRDYHPSCVKTNATCVGFYKGIHSATP